MHFQRASDFCGNGGYTHGYVGPLFFSFLGLPFPFDISFVRIANSSMQVSVSEVSVDVLSKQQKHAQPALKCQVHHTRIRV